MTRVSLIGVLVTLAIVAYGSSAASRHFETLAALPPSTISPLGDALPSVTLLATDGSSVPLSTRIKGRPAALYIYTAAECASCAGFALEFSILRQSVPDIVPILIGTGAPVAEFREYFRKANVEQSSLVDERGVLLRGLRVERAPLVLVTDASGRIVFVDSRSTSKAAHYPLGRVLHDLQQTLGVAKRAEEARR